MITLKGNNTRDIKKIWSTEKNTELELGKSEFDFHLICEMYNLGIYFKSLDQSFKYLP